MARYIPAGRDTTPHSPKSTYTADCAPSRYSYHTITTPTANGLRIFRAQDPQEREQLDCRSGESERGSERGIQNRDLIKVL